MRSPTSKFASINKGESPKGPAGKTSLPVKASLPLKRTDSFKGHAKEASNPRSSTQLIVMLLGISALAFIVFGPSTSSQVSSLASQGYSRGLLGGKTWRRAARLAINYADKCCATSQPRSCASMLEHGAHKCIQYNASELDESFKTRNAKILGQERGAGYWLWKPYIILKTLLYEMEEGDLLLYADSGSEAIGDLRPLYELAEEDDIVIFKNPPKWVHREKQWTKPDAFVIMGCPVDECGRKLQVDAAWSVWRKSFRSIQFVSEWLTYMEDERVSTDIPSMLVASTAGFAEHRHDQSCLGLLVQKWDISAYNYSFIENTFLHSRNRT